MDEQKNIRLPKSDHSINIKYPRTMTRRRGVILENAILQATWNELSEVGYANLTMDGIAIRAKTNKSVLYHRWSNKAKIVVTALNKYVLNTITHIPNTGNLSNDLLILLHDIAQPLQTIGAETIHGLIVEHLGKDMISPMPEIMHLGPDSTLPISMVKILKNAELRGDISLEKITPRIISLPIDLLQYEVFITHEPISDKTINEIVNDIFLPLVHL